MTDPIPDSSARRSEVLDAALRTFTRFGYRKTSMDDVANEARISRPGLYFLFSSKSSLFREAAERGVQLDLATAAKVFSAIEVPVHERFVDAFDAWAGRYVGPMHDAAALIEANPELLGPIALAGPAKFEELVCAALEQTRLSPQAATAARTLLSLSIGVKHQTVDRAEYRSRMADAVRLLLPAE